MSLYKAFKMDEKVEHDGVKLDYGDGDWVTVRRAGGSNKEFTKAVEKFGRRYRKQIQLDALPEEVAREEFYKIYADSVIVEFCVTNPATGAKFPAGRESCMEMFRALPDFFQDVKDQSMNLSLFRETTDEIDEKN